MCKQDETKPRKRNNQIGQGDIYNVLTFLGIKPFKSDCAQIIWEVDHDLDGYVSKNEYMTMYKKVISDEGGLEPR